MKKVVSLVLGGILTCSLFSTAVMAAPDQRTFRLSTAEKIKEMQSAGLSYEDAEYYAKFDDMVKQMEDNHQEFTIDKDTQDLSDQDVVKDIKSFRQRVLNGDKTAMKKALSSPIYKYGFEDMNKLIQNNPGRPKYDIQYPDGSKMTVTTGVKAQTQANDGKVRPSGYDEVYSGGGQVTSGGYTGYQEWQLTSGSNWGKLRVDVDFTVSTPSISKVTYARGGQSSYGSVAVQSYQASISRAQNDQSTQQPAEGTNQVQFVSSSSFSGTYRSLSMSTTSGISWTQYAFFRVYGDGVWGGYAAYFL